jgi:hypothetical protein
VNGNAYTGTPRQLAVATLHGTGDGVDQAPRDQGGIVGVTGLRGDPQ